MSELAAGAFFLGLVLVGVLALREHAALRRAQARAEALRAALEARLWEERVLEIDALQATVQELRRRTHEANNAFSTALLTAQYLLDQSRTEPFSDAVRAELVTAASGMVEALQRLRGQLDRGPRSTTTAGARSPLVQAAELGPALERCRERARRRHPRVSLELIAPDGAIRTVRVGVCGGAVGLERALGGALEHSARCARSRVEVRVTAQLGVDVIAVEIADDGAGFAADALERPIAALEDGSSDESGLGLYTAERILRASLGSLRRDNAPSGGGRIALFVPLATELAQETR